MHEMNLDWDDLRLFLAVARGGGLAMASKVTGKSPPTLSRRMLSLEQAIGKELFHRHSRGYDLTDHGTDFLDKVIDLEASIRPLENAAGKHRKALVKISAGTWMTQVLCTKAKVILGDEDDTVLRFLSADEVLDISHREAVIGIRNRRPQQIGLACRKVGQVQFAGYAVSDHMAIWARVIGKTPSALWVAAHCETSDCIEVTTARNALDLAISGTARAMLPTFIGDAHPELKRVTSPIEELQHDQWLVTHNEERFVPEIRRTIDRLHHVLRDLHSIQGLQ